MNNYYSFIKSNKFGEDTWRTLHLFGYNITLSINTIELYLVLIKRLDEGDIDISSIPKDNQIRIRQHIYLDMIMKVEILIESTIVLIAALSKGYRYVPTNMTNYEINFVYETVKKIRKKSKDLNMRVILGLPNPSKLPLNRQERRLLLDLYEMNYEYFWNRFQNLVDFYDKFRIVFGKSKHGLTMQTGIGMVLNEETPGTYIQPAEFNKSSLVCLDKRRRSEMPSGSFFAQSDDIYAGDRFNVITIVNFKDTLMTHLKRTMRELKTTVTYICQNHMTYATNCGEGYLPHDPNSEAPNEVVTKFYSESGLSADDKEKYQKIFDKIVPSMNKRGLGTYVSGEYKNLSDKITESLLNEPVTNIWISKI